MILGILIIGPKDFPIVLKKIGTWVGSFKNYFNEIQKNVTDMESTVEDELSFEEDFANIKDNKKKDE